MKAVVDTNVFVSSFFGGYPKQVIDLWKDGAVTLCLSNSIVDEYVAVLKRLGLGGEKELDELLFLFQSGRNCIFTLKTPSLKICSDPDDDKFLEAAVALGAKFIISGDRDLLEVRKYAGISILKPRAFIETLPPRHSR